MSTSAVFPALPDDDSTTMIISGNVKTWMAQREVTQVQLARAMELSQAAISYRLKGRTPWDAVDMDKLRRIFGVSAAELVSVLPRLDSNQQPAASAEDELSPGFELAEVVELAAWAAR
jgi:transcriptional regulator with XRE-family HTH domain